MAGPVSDRYWVSNRGSRNSSKAQYDINGMSRPTGVVHRGQRTQMLSEEIVTEGDRQLQELLKKQMNTSVSLDHFLTCRKEFSEATLSQPLINNVSGAMTLDGYDKWVQNSEEVDELRQAGLTEEEIAIKLRLQNSGNVQFGRKRKPRLGVDPVLMAERMKEIDRKLDEHRCRLLAPTRFAGAKVMSRQEMDLEQAITKNRDQSKHLACLVTDGSRTGATHPDHPINHLEEILEKVSSQLTNRAKRRKLVRSRNLEGGRHNCTMEVDEELEVHKPKGCHVKRNDVESEESDSDESMPQENFDVPNRPDGWDRVPEVDRVVQLPDGTKALEGNIGSIPEDVVQRYKLSLEQIRALPRFKDYTPGIPNQTIYLKNLSSRVSEADLVSLFNRFQNPNQPSIVFRLLKGRMKGQAFVKFASVEAATAALNLVNGYDFKGKPIIIEYGKLKNQMDREDEDVPN